MSNIAIVQRMKSDLTGTEADPDDFGSFVLRKGPGIDRAIAWDVLPDEIGDLKDAPDIFSVEYRAADGTLTEKLVTLKELTEKVIPKGKTLEDLTSEARSLRGRRPGTQIR